MADHLEFSPGRIVVVRSDPSLRGVLPGEAEARVKIFVNGKVRTYYASQLHVEAQSDENVQPLSCEQFHASLTALQVDGPADTAIAAPPGRIEPPTTVPTPSGCSDPRQPCDETR